LAGYTPLKYLISGKPLIAPKQEVGKFQNGVEMKVNYRTNTENSPKNFSDHFHNIKNFDQLDHLEKIIKNSLIFLCAAPKKPLTARIFCRPAKL
jgi:hypothetical protein